MDLKACLIENGLVQPEAIARAERIAAAGGGRFAEIMSRFGLIADAELADALATAGGFDRASRSDLRNLGEVGDLNVRFLRRRSCMPLSNDEANIRLVMADPTDDEARAAMAFALSSDLEPVVATFSDVAELLQNAASSELASSNPEASDQDLSRLSEDASDAPVIRLVQRLLTEAARRRASDVHVEPGSQYLAIRYRVDGRLADVERHGREWAEPVTSRIKVMAGLDIAETRLPQDGRLRLTVAGRDMDVRVSTSPVAHGESVVLRLLGRSEVPLDLERLGLPAGPLARLTMALDRPHGIVLITGPTGSGKTTTLYAAISRLRRPEVKILTVEDPVEVLLDGINQVQVRPEINLSYAATLRAFLRQDPDILMVGEIRDGETAEISLRAALTGHLVLSTLHTNSALGAFTRLADIGVEPYLAASTVVATAAQRLIRTLCASCATPRALSDDERELYAAHDLPLPPKTYESDGCTACQGSGYRGRLPLIEVVTVDDTLRDAIRGGVAEAYRPPYARSETLLGHGLSIAADGRTSLAEVRRAVQLT